METQEMKEEKTIFIRCSEQTKELLKAIKTSENRSENAQVIHMIHKEAERLGISLESNVRREKTEEQVSHESKIFGYDANGSPVEASVELENKEELKSGLEALAETRKRESLD